MNKSYVLIVMALLLSSNLIAQADRWQQRAEYEMDIDFDVKNHQYKGKQKLTYFNNSPEQIDRVFYHLYFNAFQPGSMMDIRNQNLPDADSRVSTRIGGLKEGEQGYQKVTSLKQDGKEVKFETVGTILEVVLNKPIGPGQKAVFEMDYDAQVPLQIRRSGRMNSEGIDYSMSQWYPKMCEYDYQGWHANPYVGREFHGIWGDFEVNISIAKNYIVAGTGELQNANEIGYGYEKKGATVKRATGDKLTWKFVGNNIHDFVWAADPDYKHVKRQSKDGPMMHFFFQEGEPTEAWARLPEIMDEAFTFINKSYGKYPYPVYSFIQGGDGGMEYPMATLITGHRNLGSLVGVSVHELMHSWYQMIMGTNEALYAWMDEGFTSWTSAEVMNHIRKVGLLKGEVSDNPHRGTYAGYVNLTKSGREEPLTTHADHFDTNYGYGLAAYVKGSMYLLQLEYIMGEADFDKGMLDYYDTWKFKHPNPNDFIRIMENACGLELDWYQEYFGMTTKTIDYGVTKVEADGRKKIKISLEKVGLMPMPLDVQVTMTDGSTKMYNIPLRIMRGEKMKDGDKEFEVLEDWPWTNPTYELVIPARIKKVKSVEIDPSWRMGDVDRNNNTFEVEK